jgi:hypothetical protein
MRAADDYARELLERLDRQLSAFTRSIRAGIEQLEPVPQAPQGFSPLDDDGFMPAVSMPAAEEPAYRELPSSGRYQAPASEYAADAYDRDEEREAASTGELENLLRPARTSTPRSSVAPAEPGVIDDFEHEPLDDDPLYRGRRLDDR